MGRKAFLLVALILLCVLIGATGLAAGTCESDCAATKSSCDGDCDTIWNDCYWTCESNWYNCKDSCDMTYDGCMGDCDTNWYNCNDNCDMTYDGCMGDCDMNWNSCRGDCDMMYDGCCMDCDMMYDPGTPEHDDCMMMCEDERWMCYDGCDGTKNDCEMQCDGERGTCHDDCDMTKSNCESGCAGDRTSCYSPCDTEKTSCEGICDGTKTSCLGDCSDNYVICLASCSPVPDPINIAHTKGLFWVNHTWDIEPGGDIIDSFNVSINQTWYNSTTDMFYNNTGLSTWGQWSNITVWAFNNTNGSSDASVSENVQLPMPIPAVPVGTGGTWDFYWVNHSWAAGSSYGIWCGETDSYNYSVTTHLLGGSPNTVWYNDSTNTSHNNSLGVYGWSNITVYAFNDTAGINETYIYQDVQVPKYIPADPTNLQHTFGYYWANHTWDEGAGGYATDSYNVSIEGKGWYNGTLHTWHKDVLSVHGWSNITVYAFNSTHAVLSVNPVTADVYVPHEHANMVNINQTGWWLTGGAFTMSGTPLQDGFNNMISGHGAYVYAGAYTESVTISIAHTTITTEGKDVVNITSPSGSHCIDVNADHVTLSGFELSNATTVNCAGVYIANQQYCTISDIHTHNNHFGLYPDSSTHIEFTNINSHSNGQTAQFGGGSYINVTDSICNGIYLVSTSHNTCTNVSCGTITLYQGGSHVFDRCAISHITQNSWTGSITIRDHVTETLRYTGWGHGFSLTITNTGGRVFTTSKDTATTAFPNGMFTCAPITSFYPHSSMYIYQQDATMLPSVSEVSIADYVHNHPSNDSTTFTADCSDAGNTMWVNITKDQWINTKIGVFESGSLAGTASGNANGLTTYNYTGGFSEKSFNFRQLLVADPILTDYEWGFYWVNRSWTHGADPIVATDSYNVSINGTWYNETWYYSETTELHYNHSLGAPGWSYFIIYAYNETYGVLSQPPVVDPIYISDPAHTGDIHITEGGWSKCGERHRTDRPASEGISNATAGCNVYIYNGSYIDNVCITVNTTIIGESMDGVLISALSTSDHVIDVQHDDIQIANLTVQGATSAYGISVGTYIPPYQDVKKNNVLVSYVNASGNYIGIRLIGDNGTVTHCVFTDNHCAASIGPSGWLGDYYYTTNINHCTMHSNTGDGLYVRSIRGTYIRDNLMYSNGGHGISIYFQFLPTYSASLSNNTVYNNSGHGISWVSGNTFHTVSFYDNKVYENGNDGIHIRTDYASSYSVYNNVIYSNAHCGVGISGEGGGVSLSNNNVSDYDGVYGDFSIQDGVSATISQLSPKNPVVYIDMKDTGSSFTIYNTSGYAAFDDVSGYAAYAYTNGYYGTTLHGTSEMVQITQRFDRTMHMKAHDTNVQIWDIDIADVSTWNASCTNPVGTINFNITHGNWSGNIMSIYANDGYVQSVVVGADGIADFDYIDGFSTTMFRIDDSDNTPNPANLQYTTGIDYVDYTWDTRPGAVVDSYNVSINGTWYNDTLTEHYRHDLPGTDVWSHIIVYTYNNTLGLGNRPLSEDVFYEAFYPGTPISLTHRHDDCDVIWTWAAGSGFVTDSYNVSITTTLCGEVTTNWYTTTSPTYTFDVTCDQILPTIHVYAWNSTHNVKSAGYATEVIASLPCFDLYEDDFEIYVIGSQAGWTCSGTPLVSVRDDGDQYFGVHGTASSTASKSFPCMDSSDHVYVYFQMYCEDHSWVFNAIMVKGSGTDIIYIMAVDNRIIVHPGGGAAWGNWYAWTGWHSIEFTYNRKTGHIEDFKLDGSNKGSFSTPIVNTASMSIRMDLDSVLTGYTMGIDDIYIYPVGTFDCYGCTVSCGNHTIVLYDNNDNLIQNAEIFIYDITNSEYVQKWTRDADGIMSFIVENYGGHTLRIGVDTFDGTFVHDVYIDPDGGLTTITVPLRYNLNVYPKDEQGVPLTDVFCGLSEYTPLNPQAFWGFSMCGSQYVPITNCSGFPMCDIYAEKGGYEDYNATALNWTSKSAMIKDYRHTATLTKE